MKFVYLLLITLSISLSLYSTSNITQGQQNVINHIADKIVHINIVATNSNGLVKYLSFEPSQIKIKVGTTVIWTNNDTAVHTVINGNPLPNLGGFLKDFVNQSY